MTADALIRNRDAIVGAWNNPLEPRPIDTAGHVHLKRWEPWVRATIFDFELVSRLRFQQARDECALWYLPDPPAGEAGSRPDAGQPLARLRAPGRDVFVAQLEHVRQQAELREDRASEILAQMGLPIPFWAAIVNLHPSRTAKTLELLEAALRLANFVHQRFKHALACNRPLEYSGQLQPMILTPGHGSLPSGHSTEAFTVANVLAELLELGAADVMWEQLMRQAARIAINRQIAGVHFPVDSMAGQVLGSAVADYFVFRCTGKGGVQTWSFDPPTAADNPDFNWRTLSPRDKRSEDDLLRTDPGPLRWLWEEATKEVKS